jgi:hypothetical protein
MLVKLLILLSVKYELEGTRISVDYREVRATFTFLEHELPKNLHSVFQGESLKVLFHSTTLMSSLGG